MREARTDQDFFGRTEDCEAWLILLSLLQQTQDSRELGAGSRERRARLYVFIALETSDDQTSDIRFSGVAFGDNFIKMRLKAATY